MSKSILNRIRIFQENISPALGPGQSRPNILLKNTQAPFYYFVNYFLIETDLRIRIYKIKKFHTTLQPDTFSISFTLPFVSRFSFCSFFVSLTFLFNFFHCPSCSWSRVSIDCSTYVFSFSISYICYRRWWRRAPAVFACSCFKCKFFVWHSFEMTRWCVCAFFSLNYALWTVKYKE